MDENDHVAHAGATAFAELSGLLLAGGPVDATLLRVAQAVKKCIAGVGDVSVSMIDRVGARTVVFTGAQAIELDEVQYELGRGPCLDAARTQRTVVVDTSRDTRYHQFSQVAHRQGVRHTVSIGLATPHRSAAGLNIYGTAAGSFDGPAVTLARAFANYASVAVGRSGRPDDDADASRWLAAIRSRAAVDAAVLAVMAERSRTRDEAVAELLDLARRQRRPLAEVAQSISDR
jgi:hypothetical protein